MVRPITLDDAAAVARIYQHYVEHTAVSFEEVAPTVEEMRARIAASHRVLPWLVAESDGEVVGYAYAVPHRNRASYRWSVDVSIYLAPSATGQGRGGRLYQELFRILRWQGYRRAHAGITLPNSASIGIHRSFGFTDVGTYPNVGFKFGTWHDTHWMTMELLPAISDPPEPILSPEFSEDGNKHHRANGCADDAANKPTSAAAEERVHDEADKH